MCADTRHTIRIVTPIAERTAPDPKKLCEIALYNTCPFREISTECFGEFPRCLRLSFGLREVNCDFDCLVVGQFASPSDNIFFCFSIQIFFPKWERIERVEKLRNIVDTELYQVVVCCGCHDVVRPIANGLAGREQHIIAASS